MLPTVIQIQMIGFSQDLQDFGNARTEGPDTVHLQKNELYELVSKDYFLPPCTSRGVSREYLLKVKEGKVFRITNTEWKNFEFKLSKEQFRKGNMINNAILMRKLNRLLKSYNKAEMGFDEYNIPEQNWLYKVARYIDRTNLLEFFEVAVQPEPAPTHNSTPYVKIYFGRLYASEYLFSDPRKKSNKKLWGNLRTLSEAYRMLMGSKIHAEVLEHDLLETRRRIAEQEANLQDLLGKASFAYIAIDNPELTADVVINKQAQLTEEQKKEINRISQL